MIAGVLLVLLFFAILALMVVSIMGNVYLTRFAFSSSTSDTRTVELKNWQMGMAQTTVVLFWISLAGAAMLQAYQMGTAQKTGNNRDLYAGYMSL